MALFPRTSQCHYAAYSNCAMQRSPAAGHQLETKLSAACFLRISCMGGPGQSCSTGRTHTFRGQEHAKHKAHSVIEHPSQDQ